MLVNDPVADMLTRIRNALTARHETVDIPRSKVKLAIADILKDEGYICGYELVGKEDYSGGQKGWCRLCQDSDLYGGYTDD